MTHASRAASTRALLAAFVATVLAAVTIGVTPVATPSAPASSTSSEATTRPVVAPDVLAAVADGPTKVLVRVAPSATTAALSAVEAAGGQVTQRLEIIDGFAAELDAAALRALLAVDGVRDVIRDGQVTLAHTGPNGERPEGDSFYNETIGADLLHAQGIDGSGVGIAVIDTGVSPLADFSGRIVGAADFSGDGDDLDRYGHGTFIAGIAAGDGASSNGEHAGVAPGAHIVPVKIAGWNGSSDVSHVLAAIQYVVSFKDAYDIGVMNLSLGTDSDQSQLLSPLNFAVERAWDAGIVVVVSGGNHGADGPGRIPKPADDPLVLTVGATDSWGTVDRADDQVAGYSSRGPSIADGFEKPDIVAPGSHLVSLVAPNSALASNTGALVDGAHAQGSGTSFAAAVASGAVALLRQAHPDWTPDQVKDAITSSAAPGPVGDRNVDGFGALDVAAAAAADPAPGSQALVVRSSGLGSLHADRGSLRVEVSTTGLFNTLAYLLGKVFLITGSTTVQLQDFDATEYTTTDWTGSQWYGSQWYGSQWYGSQWYGSQWYGSQWYGSQWYGGEWT
jgi:serine protease AprX